MKKIYSLLLLAAALLCLPMGVKGETLTVANGSSLRQQLPVFGYNCDGAQHNQFIYLASELSDMNGGEITALKFYLEKQSYTWSSNGAPVATFRFAEVEATTVSSLISVDETFTQVDSKQIVFASGEWIVELTTPYQYKGGNLLVDVQTPAAGYVNSNSNTGSRFYSAEADYRGNYNGTVQYYVPKITFTYEEAAAEGACNKPKNLTLSEELPDGATFTWEQNADETTYQWACVAAGAEVETWNSLEENVRTKTVTGLTVGTSYDFYVRSYCGSGEDEQSAGVKKNFTPTCPAPTYPTTPVTDITANSVTVTWNAVDGITKYQSVCVLKNATPDWADVEAKESLTAELTELTASTEYDFYVRSYYSATSQSSAVKTSFKTACGVVSLPFNEDFSSAIDCWTMESCESGTGISSGKFSFRYTQNPPQYLITPELTTSEKQVKVTFDYSVYSTSDPETFLVGYSTTTNELSAFTWGDPITYAKTTAEKYTDILPAGVKYIAIQCTSDYKYYLYIDNFSATEYVAPACAVPTGLAASEITANSAKIAWTSEAEAWKLQTSADGENWSDVEGEITNPYVLTGLTANTKYYVHVCANCGANGDSEWTAAINFTTECETATLPFGPESFSEGKLPGCWSAASQWTIYPYDGNSMRYTSSTAADLTLPAIALSDKAQLTFRRQSSYVSCSVYVNDGENETKLADFEKSTSWAQSTVDLSAYAGKTVTIIIRGNYVSGSRYLYIDDVAVSYKPVAAPTNLAATPANASAVITWECDEEDATYTLRYRANGGEGEWTEVADLTAKTYTIESLTNGTAYEVQVKAIASANRQSDWTASAVVTPQACPTITGIELSEKTYSSVKVSWTTSGAGTWTLQYGVNPSMTIVNDLTATEYVLTNLSAGQTYTISVVPTCSEDAQQTTYTPVYTAPANAAVASITDAAATASWEAVADAPNGYKYVVVAKDATPDWHSEAVKATSELTASLTGLDALTEYDFYVAALYGETLSPATKTTFTTITVAPKNLTVSAITATTATLAWENDGAATAYEYAVGNDPAALEWAAVAEATKTLGDLTANTSYTFYVRAKYSDVVKSDSIKLTFRTECEAYTVDAENSFTENFSGLTTSGTIPECWDNSEGTTTNAAYKWSYYSTGSDGGPCVRFNSYYNSYNTNVLATPAIQLTADAVLKFSCKNPKGGAYEVKISANGGERETLLSNLVSISTWTEKEVDLSGYTGKSVVIYFCGTSNDGSGDAYLYLDAISITAIPDCGTPKNLHITDLLCNAASIAWETEGKETAWVVEYATNDAFTEGLVTKDADATSLTLTGLTVNTDYYVRVKGACEGAEYSSVITITPSYKAPTDVTVDSESITTTAAAVDWTANSGEAAWTVQYKKTADAEWTSVENVTAHPYTLTGLAPSTNYEVRVLAGEEASARVSFTTDCAAVAALGYAEGFEGMTTGNYSETGLLCWDELNAVHSSSYSYPQVYVNTESTYVKSGSKSLYFVTSNSTNVYAILPILSGSFDGLQMTFWHKEENATASGAITLGYFTDIENEETFVSLKECERKTKEWQEEIVNLSSVPSNVRLAFRCGTGNNNYYGGIDDISITEIPSCVVPTGLAASEITASTATLSWTSEAENFKVQYTTDKADWGEEHAVAAKTFALEDLNEQTTYYARVKAVCGEENESEYSAEISFTTPCAVKAMPYAEDFEDGVPACWETTGSWTTNSEYAHSGNALRADVKNKVATLTMPAIAISEEDAELVFYVRNIYGGSSYVTGSVIIAPVGGESKNVAIINSNDINNKQKVDLSEFNGQNVVISFNFGSANATANVSIDDVTVAKMQCATPTNLEATAADGQAEVTWAKGDDEAAWQLRYKATAAENWNEIGDITATAYTLTGLVNGTEYEVQVRAYCDETHQSEWTASATFTPSKATGIGNTSADNKTVKLIENDQIIIIRDGVKYNAQGQKMN